MRFQKDEIKKMMKIIKDEMISVANSDFHSFSIPLTVDINSGDNWGITSLIKLIAQIRTI